MRPVMPRPATVGTQFLVVHTQGVKVASRRNVLTRLAALSGAAGLTGCSRLLDPSTGSGVRGLPANPRTDVLPDAQFAHTDFLRRGSDGNPIQPHYRRLLLLSLEAPPSVEAARTVERAMRTVEASYDWGPDGLFHMLGWGTAYFERVGELGRSPVDRPRRLSRVDDPDLESYGAVLVLSSNVPSHLTATDTAMFGGRDALNGESVENRLGEVFSVTERRTGFLGEGLPTANAEAEGVPADALSPDDPMFMGFFSGRAGTQASEERVRIDSGPFADGTTMHLSHLTQNLHRWWRGLDADERVDRMFAPSVSPGEVADFETDVPFADAVRDHAREYGVVGHHEKVARVREGGEPLILRRDFNTVDGGHAGTHFLALQADLADFRRTRKAMNGWYLRDDSPAVGEEANNGILDFITVESRANFYIPPRNDRAFPLR